MVETPELATGIATWCRYRPQGVRELAFGMAHDDYAGGDHIKAVKPQRAHAGDRADRDRRARNVEAIMATPGIDVGWLGHYDLTNALGIDGQFDHPRYRAAAKAIARACERNKKAAGFLCGDVKTGRQYLDWGFRILAYGTDTGVFQGALKAGIDGLRGRKG